MKISHHDASKRFTEIHNINLFFFFLAYMVKNVKNDQREH